ncbi:ABC transporter [Streptomyces sp. Ru73]|nr:ABC transporter [Streptomyces sp. Ru73]
MLRDVDLEVPRAALLRFEGANGSGKSTLLRLLAGIDAPSTGRVTGRPRTAYVPERFPAALPFTALGYLSHLGRVHGLRGAEPARRATEWLERFGAAGHARTPLAELSKGTSQKVAVAQALLAEPELLVLDEAWTGLDRTARGTLDRAVAERVAAGGTVVFVDHDPARLAGAADACYRVVDTGLRRQEAAAYASDAAPGPRVTVVAQGPPGADPPPGLPGAPRTAPGPDGTTRLTVPATHSDTLLHALLTARPPWHIHAVAPEEARPTEGARSPEGARPTEGARFPVPEGAQFPEQAPSDRTARRPDIP